MCSAIFGKAQKDALDKTVYFNGVRDTDYRIRRADRFELTELRTLFRDAHDLDLELNNTSRFSFKKYWLRNAVENQRAAALKRSLLAKSIFKRALDDAQNDRLLISNHDRNIRVIVQMSPGRATEIALDTPRIADSEAERVYVEAELARTLKEIERTEQYYIYHPPTKEQVTKFHTLVESFAQSKTVVLLRKGRTLPIDTKNLMLGKSYLVIIAHGRLVLGDGYKNTSGGTANTHGQLRDDLDVDLIKGHAGSLRFNVDGSVDISGYHSKKNSEESAQMIFELVRTASPAGTVLRTTPGRISDL